MTPVSINPHPPAADNGGMNTTHRAYHITELPQGFAPAWVQLIPAGEFTGRDGRGPYTLDAQTVLDGFKAWGMPVAIDYEHQSLNTEENGQPAPAAGWIKQLDSRADGIWGQVEWTDRAATMISAREYRYLSPVFEHSPKRRVQRLTGAGLTNNPNLYLTAIARRQAHSLEQEQAMNELLQQLIAALNLPATATPDEALGHARAQADSLKTASATAAQMRELLGLPADAPAETLTQSLQARINQTEPDPARFVPFAEFERVSHALRRIEGERNTEITDRLVATAMKEGKVSPGMEPWARSYCARDRAGFEQYIGVQPGLVDAHAKLSVTPPAAGNAKNPLLADAEARAQA